MFITLEDVKNHIDLDSNDDDEILGTYINAIGDFLKNYLGRVVEETDIEEYFDGDEITDTIFLSHYPITDLEIAYNSGTYSNPEWTEYDVDEYQVDAEKGMILVDVNYPGRRNIQVSYTAGYAAEDIPSAIKLAAIKLAAKIYNKKRSDGFKHEEAGGAAIDWDSFLSDDITALLNPYRKINI